MYKAEHQDIIYEELIKLFPPLPIFCQENFLALSIPLFLISSNSLYSVLWMAIILSLSANSLILNGLKYKAASPQTSFNEGMFDAKTKQLFAIASKAGKPNPSIRDGIIRANAFWYKFDNSLSLTFCKKITLSESLKD